MTMIRKQIFSSRKDLIRFFLCEAVLFALLAAAILCYRRIMKPSGPDRWTVTQYAPDERNASFYTIYNPAKGLIVVDGGWEEDAEYVRGVLASLGGKVDAWLLTHPHPDHIGAFVKIWQDPGDLQIGDLYTVEMASPEDCLEVAPWDTVDEYNAFLSLDLPDLNYVHTADELNLCGLPVEIFSAFDEEVRDLSADYLNDGSMMFKVTGPEKTFLFCADVGKRISRTIERRWKKKLKSDYVQMGHHGNGGLREKFYKKVAPEAAFFDAPDWLMEDPEGRYNTPKKIALMESLGCTIYSFHTAPNSVTI